jgi:acyl-coenzyme A thioesterase PaaI-like protein
MENGPVDQARVSRGALAAVGEFLGGPERDGDGWTFHFGEHLESNWGAVYGGALAAGALAVARAAAPDQSPRSLHLQIVRSVPRGTSHATARVRHAGRTVTTVEVELTDNRGKLAVVALVTMVTPDAVAASFHDTSASPKFNLTYGDPDEEIAATVAPIQDALKLRTERDGEAISIYADNLRPSVDGRLAPVGECTLPWDALDLTGPEAACLASDALVGLPVMQSFIPLEHAGPNADLTLRFTTAPATRLITTATTMLSLQHGTAIVGIEVQAGDQQLAHGLATSLLLNRT